MFFFLMLRSPPRSTRTGTLFPYTTRFRSLSGDWGLRLSAACGGRLARCFRELPAVGPDPDRWHCAGHDQFCTAPYGIQNDAADLVRSEEHTSELQSLIRISYAAFCLKK